MADTRPVNINRELLRGRLLAARRSYEATAFDDSAARLATALSRLLDDDPAGTVAGYWAVGGEIDLTATLALLASKGWRVVLPVCKADASMEFAEWADGDTMEVNGYGIPEPQSRAVDLSVIDIVLTPGVGFDARGSRIGHGVGYYDRFFARCAAASHDPLRVGVAHDYQIVDRVPTEAWDVSMNVVVTPQRTFDLRATSGPATEGPGR